MRPSYAVLFAACLFTATPVMAGVLTSDNGKPVWHSTQCPKPAAPPAITDADRDSGSEHMNELLTQHNAFVDAAQTYMNCINSEAERDQTSSDDIITAEAQKDIADMQDEIKKSLPGTADHKE